MSQLERQNKILELLHTYPSMSVKELSAALFASEASVRRDIINLEQRGLVTHIYGGVMLAKYYNSVKPVEIRDGQDSAIKDQIAARAVKLIRDGDTLFMDSSSTVRRMLPFMGQKKDLKIITNNYKIFAYADEIDAKFYCTGGEYDRLNHNFRWASAEAFIQTVKTDIMFFSCQGLTEDGEINDVSEAETALRRAMLSRTKRKVFLCDSGKIGISMLFTLCRISDVDEIICDDRKRIEKIRERCKL